MTGRATLLRSPMPPNKPLQGILIRRFEEARQEPRPPNYHANPKLNLYSGTLANPTTVDFVLLLNPAKFTVVLQAFQSAEGALQGWI